MDEGNRLPPSHGRASVCFPWSNGKYLYPHCFINNNLIKDFCPNFGQLMCVLNLFQILLQSSRTVLQLKMSVSFSFNIHLEFLSIVHFVFTSKFWIMAVLHRMSANHLFLPALRWLQFPTQQPASVPPACRTLMWVWITFKQAEGY